MKAGKMTKLIAGCCCFGMLTMYGEKDLAQESGLSDYIEETEEREIESLEENEKTEDLEEITVESAAEEEKIQILDQTDSGKKEAGSETNVEKETESETVTDTEKETGSETVTDAEKETESEAVTDAESGTESEAPADVGSEAESEASSDAETEPDSEVLAVTYEIEDQRLESGKTFDDIVVPECAIAEDGSKVTGEVQWKVPGYGITVDSDMEISGKDGECVTWEWAFIPEEQNEYEMAEGAVELTLYAAKKPAERPVPDKKVSDSKDLGESSSSGSSTDSINVIRVPSVKDAAKWMGSAMTGVGELGSGKAKGDIRQVDEKLTISHGTVIREENGARAGAAKTDTISENNPDRKADTADEKISDTDKISNTDKPGRTIIPGRFVAGRRKVAETVSVKDVFARADHADTGSMVQMTGFSGGESTQTGIDRTGIFQNLWQMLGRGLFYMLFSGFGFLK